LLLKHSMSLPKKADSLMGKNLLYRKAWISIGYDN